VLLCLALPASAAADREVVPDGMALPVDATHEKPVPQKTISGSLLAAAVGGGAEVVFLSRAAQIVISGTGRRAL
jgi:hypothetical protein